MTFIDFPAYFRRCFSAKAFIWKRFKTANFSRFSNAISDPFKMGVYIRYVPLVARAATSFAVVVSQKSVILKESKELVGF